MNQVHSQQLPIPFDDCTRISPPLPPAFEYTNMPPPVNMGDNPMYVAADKVPTSSGPPSSQNTLSRQFMNPLYDYEEDEGIYIQNTIYISENFLLCVL